MLGPEAFEATPYLTLLDNYGIHHAMVEMAPGANRPPRMAVLSRARTFSARLLERLSAIGAMLARRKLSDNLRTMVTLRSGTGDGMR